MENFQRDLEQYFNDIKKEISKYGLRADSYLKDFISQAKEFIEQENISNIDLVIQEFGTAKENCEQYIAGLDKEEICTATNRKKIIRYAVIAFILIVTVVASIFMVKTFSKYEEGYFVEDVDDGYSYPSTIYNKNFVN